MNTPCNVLVTGNSRLIPFCQCLCAYGLCLLYFATQHTYADLAQEGNAVSVSINSITELDPPIQAI